MRIAVVDENASRAAAIGAALSAVGSFDLTVITETRKIAPLLGSIAPDIILIDFANPARDMLEEHFAANRALARPVTLFVDGSTAAAIDAGVSAYALAGRARERVPALLDIAAKQFSAFAGEAK